DRTADEMCRAHCKGRGSLARPGNGKIRSAYSREAVQRAFFLMAQERPNISVPPKPQDRATQRLRVERAFSSTQGVDGLTCPLETALSFNCVLDFVIGGSDTLNLPPLSLEESV